MVGPLLGAMVSIAVFLCGLFVLRGSLEAMKPVVGPLLRTALKRPIAGLFAGLTVTAVIQSSSATNAMVVSLVAADVIGLRQAIAIVLGANVGTTLTAQIAALGNRQIGTVAFLVGLVLQAAPAASLRRLGTTCTGLGGLFLGLEGLGMSMHNVLAGSSWPASFIASPTGDLGAVAVGAALTGVVQSSSAVTSLLVGLVRSGAVDLRTGIAVALGSNIGTVVTTVLASLSGGPAAKRVAVADAVFNTLGVLIFVPLIPHVSLGVAHLSSEPGRQLAHTHMLFNITTVALLFPWLSQYCRVIETLTRRCGRDR